MHVSVVVGTRPEIIKMASIITLLKKNTSITYDIIHTEQHYDYNMNNIFFENLSLPFPKYCLSVGSDSQAQQTAKAMEKIEPVLLKTQPDIVLVQGDTNTVLAAALTATKLHINVGHVEAGLRSYDMRMPEEHNRRVTDHLSAYLFAPTIGNKKILEKENIWGKIFVTGNTVIDACIKYLPKAEQTSTILNQIRFNKYALVTAHRAENVDNPSVLKNFITIFKESPVPIVYPIHPRTVKRLQENNWYRHVAKHDNIQLIEPVGYFDFLVLMKHASCILTDSGGIQEEATAYPLQKKVFILRESTERPEAVETGFATVVGVNAQAVLQTLNSFIDKPEVPKVPSPFGDGKAGEHIVKILTNTIK